ncbi:MAG: cytochrome d ubiquinol oxidase subunit II [Betaproteobacteria bacterium]|nr:cytochrome d ubiquinol oxidase subunit II [Betaproteobacteria bacterium]MBU6511783.1 cytochrome d ubiquinol oxidase subunit II [Betaproteobacteria bacterium]MDE1955071.1 cytochrome d ubiquinol oxidase subunit II [Betaproteobacteria bacterium]MDE2152091.1 cytochrome d ubiquinol oxidase subunit II [Betaproteobacteria bacterium]MDE2479701.1 cytochrome d ubiquinol oxidase subunit II [Betaproteobacteria bacterium]
MDLYATLEVAWWGVLGIVLAGTAVLMGGDMGVGALLRLVARDDAQRRACLNAIGPHWEGNQTWFVAAGGASFAAFPLLYATAFSALYLLMMLLLWSMLLRPVGFEYRSKLPQRAWRETWDWALVLGGAVPMLVFGAAFGQLLLGVAFDLDWNLRSSYGPNAAGLLRPFALLCGALALALAALQGATLLMQRCERQVAERARACAMAAAAAALLLFGAASVWAGRIEGWELLRHPGPGAVQTPLQQAVAVYPGAWRLAFARHPALWLLPALAALALLGALVALRARRGAAAWRLGVLAWVGVLGTAGASLFPFLLPSRTVPAHSLTVWNAASSRDTLLWMSGFAAVLLPTVALYTRWCFRVMRGKVRQEEIQSSDHAY